MASSCSLRADVRRAVRAALPEDGLVLVALSGGPDSLALADGDRDRVLILTPDGGAEVERLVRAGVPLVDLEVRPLTLEEALAVRESTR